MLWNSMVLTISVLKESSLSREERWEKKRSFSKRMCRWMLWEESLVRFDTCFVGCQLPTCAVLPLQKL